MSSAVGATSTTDEAVDAADRDVLATSHSKDDAARANIYVLLLSCCGFDFARNVADGCRVLSAHPVPARLRADRDIAIYAADSNRYLARTGPQLVSVPAAVPMVAARGDTAA